MTDTHKIEVTKEQLEELGKKGFNVVWKSDKHLEMGKGRAINYEISKFKEPQLQQIDRMEFGARDIEDMRQLRKEIDLYMKLYNFSLANGGVPKKEWITSTAIGKFYYIRYDGDNDDFYIYEICRYNDFCPTIILFRTKEIAAEALRRYRKELEDVFGISKEERKK